MIIIYMRKNTQVRSTIKAWLTEEGCERLRRTGRLEASEAIADGVQSLSDAINMEAKHVVEALGAWKKAIGEDVPIPFKDVDFPYLISVASLSVREFVSSCIWEFLANCRYEMRDFVSCINTHKTRSALARNGIVTPCQDLPANDKLWSFVYQYVPEDKGVFEWYLADYESVKNKNPQFDSLFRCNIRRILTECLQ